MSSVTCPVVAKKYDPDQNASFLSTSLTSGKFRLISRHVKVLSVLIYREIRSVGFALNSIWKWSVSACTFNTSTSNVSLILCILPLRNATISVQRVHLVYISHTEQSGIEAHTLNAPLCSVDIS